MIPHYQQKHTGEYLPLLEKFDAHRIEMVKLLDRVHDNKLFNKVERAKLDKLIA